MWVYGIQLGWFSLGGSYGIYDIVQPQYSETRSFIKLLADLKNVAKQFLTFGRLMRSLFPDNANSIPPVYPDGCTVSAVLTTAWATDDAEDGLGLAMTNSANATVPVILKITRNLYELGSGGYTGYEYSPDGSKKAIGTFTEDPIELSFNMTSQSAMFIQLAPTTRLH